MPAMLRGFQSFQYQKGAIKTFVCLGITYVDHTFNTKKVRLKHYEVIPDEVVKETFNTKKVRLKPARGRGFPARAQLSIPKRCD